MMRSPGRGFVRPLSRVVVGVALLVVQLWWPAAADAAGPEPTLIDVVILVDESGSLSDADVRREVEAATTIGLGVLNTRSRVSVYGFGSQNAPGQNAITEACSPTVLDSQVKKDNLAACIRKLHRRTDREGNDTDHAAALAKAVDTLRDGGPEGALKVVFLLTDGRLDVSDSPNYGRIPADRNGEAQKQVTTQLALAATNHVQVWPLGFGDQIDQAALDGFAAGGDREACDGRPESKPKARVVRDSADVLRSLTEAFAAASCSGVSRSDTTSLSAGQTRELKIDIPIIATDGSITVAKGDPRVRAEFVDPSGRTAPADGRLGDSEFKRAGENSVVETLRVVNPRNGQWTIRLTAPRTLSRQLVSATALWQGAVSSSIVVEPPSARTGQRLTVRLSLVTRRGAVTDGKALAGLTFTVQATGPSLTGPQSIVVRDDGKAPDDRASDGRYAGTVTTPDQPGDLTFTGVVSGYGVRAEKVPVTVAVGADAPVLQGRVHFDSDAVVHPGTRVHGTVTMENGGAAAQGRLVLDGPGHTRAALGGETDFTIRQGTTDHRFEVLFPGNAGLGGTSLIVKVVDPADLSKVHAVGQLTVTVEAPPGWVERHRYALAAGALLVLVLAALLWMRRRAHRNRVDVRGLWASLRQDGDELVTLKAPNKWAREFRFAIRDAETGTPHLDYPRAGDRPVRVRRGAAGKVVAVTPDGDRYEIAVGSEGEPLGETGLMLAFTDRRARRSAWARTRRANGSRTDRTGAGGPGRPEPGRAEEPATASPTYDDPWL